MLALTLINLCSREYQDVGFARIARDSVSATVTNSANWLDLLNDAQRAVVLARPDANAVTTAVLLAAGTRQSLPTGSLRLLDVSRNMGAGATPGDTIRLAERDVQDMVNRSWHKNPVGTVVREVFYNDKKDPLVYWVTPPVPSGTNVYIEITTSNAPTDVDFTVPATAVITLSDTYATAMQAWMLYRAYAMATQALNQFQRSQFYFSAFFNLLGVKAKNDMWFSPNTSDLLPAVASGAR